MENENMSAPTQVTLQDLQGDESKDFGEVFRKTGCRTLRSGLLASLLGGARALL